MVQSIPPLTWFRAFESAARHLSFTKAADELNLTQSAVSQHVRSLENRFGCDLFIRQHRSLQLTDQGRRLLPKVTNAIAGLADVARAFDPNIDHETLTVVASPSVARALIIPELSSFTEAHPNVTVRLSTRTWPDEFSSLEADVEVRFDTAQSARKSGIFWGRQRMQVVAAPSLLERISTPIRSPSDCMSFPQIGVLGTADTWESWAEENGTKLKQSPVAQVEAHGLAVEMALAGLGLAFTNSLIAAPFVAKGALQVLFESERPVVDGYFLFVKQKNAAPSSNAFKAWLEALVA